MLVQAERAKLVVVDTGAGPQAVARAAVMTHRLVVIDDVEVDPRMQSPPRHRAGTDRGKIVC